MRSTTKRLTTKGLLATLIIASTLTLGACQGQKQTQAEAEQPKVSQTTQNQATPVKATSQAEVAPDGWVVVDNKTFIPVVDQLGEHLYQARQAYLKGDNMAAAVAMREGSAFLKRELPQANKQGQAALNRASEDLTNNAALVESGKIDSVKDLDKVFATAYQADTEHLWIVADEQDWIPIVEMSQQHWQTAKQEFLNQNNRAAAIEIRKGVAFLNLEANRTNDRGIKTNISNSAQNLEQLAKDIQNGKVSNVKVIDRAFAQGQLAMGQFYQSQAKASESQGELAIAGNEVIAAFHHLQAANTWLGKDNADLKQAQAEVEAVRDNLGSPNEALSRNLSPAIATVGEQITNLNQNIAQS
ncbi:hypothetical protein [Myxosarcina sp. GI1(2024)]